MLLKFVQQLEEIGVALVQLFEHLLNGMLVDGSAGARAPLQSQPNEKFVPINSGMETANKAINGGKIIVEDTSTHCGSIKLLHMRNLLLLSGSHHGGGAASATTRASAIASGSAAQRRSCDNDKGGSEGVDSDGNGRDSDSDGSANETEGRGKSCTAEKANSGARGAEAAVELVLELGEGAAHLVEIVGVGVVRRRERVV